MVKIKSQSSFLKSFFLRDIRQTEEYAQFMKKIGWQVEEIQNQSEIINVFIKKLPLFPFSVLKVLRYQTPFNPKKIMKIIKKYHVFLAKFQPFVLKEDESFWKTSSSIKLKPDSSPLIPTKTLWLNLKQSNNQLLKQMKTKTRYNLKLSQRKNLEISVISGNKITKKKLKEFWRLWSKNKPFNFFFKPSFSELESLVTSFSQKCFFVLVNKHLTTTKQKLIAGCLILTSSNMAFYWHNFSTLEGKKLFAPTLFVWEAIKEAKRRHLSIFDFEGLWDERLPKVNLGWKGFTHFKLGFGGQLISFILPKKAWFLF